MTTMSEAAYRSLTDDQREQLAQGQFPRAELPERINYSKCAWPATVPARFREREDDRTYDWMGRACSLCGHEVWTAPEGIEVHSAVGNQAVDW